MTYSISAVGVDFTRVTADPEFTLGTTVRSSDGGEWTYVKAGTALTQYDFAGIDENFSAAPLTDAIALDGWIVGVAQVAFTVNYYGWLPTRGANISGTVGASCAADVDLWTSATGGVLDDDSTTIPYTKIDGVVAVGANTLTIAAAVEVLLTFPRSSAF